MGITLKQISILLLISTIISCKTKMKDKNNVSKDSNVESSYIKPSFGVDVTKEIWITNFKKLAYYDLLKSAYRNDQKLYQELFENIDISTDSPFYGSIYSTSLKNIDNYLKKEYDNIIQDSIMKSKGFTPRKGKRVLNKALDFYTSRLLDSISQEEYKKWIELPQSKRDSIYGRVVG